MPARARDSAFRSHPHSATSAMTVRVMAIRANHGNASGRRRKTNRVGGDGLLHIL